MDDDAAYLALAARDARFDGRFFVGVTSTRVYCRPVCRVRLPRRNHCRFFASAARAEAEGFRPCLRCRPETAPGWSNTDASAMLAVQAAALIDRRVDEGQPLDMTELAARLGITDRHLRRIFQHTHGVAPAAYLRTRRLLLAKRLLTDTCLPVTEVAQRAGFGSLRRFHAAFRDHYRLTPTALRPAGVTSREDLTLTLSYRPPYDHRGMVGFLARRQVRGLEWVEDDRVRRIIALPAQDGTRALGWIELHWRPEADKVAVRIDPRLAHELARVLSTVRQALDLDADPATVETALAPIMTGPWRSGIRVPGAFDPFEAAVRIVLGQQVSVAAAATLTARLVEAIGTPVDTPWPLLCRAFPTASEVADADPEMLGRLGIVRQRVRALQSLAVASRDGLFERAAATPVAQTLAALVALPGVGDWTAQLIAMRCLAWPDAFAPGDLGVLQALGHRDPRRAREKAEAWRPWRAYAMMQLWSRLE